MCFAWSCHWQSPIYYWLLEWRWNLYHSLLVFTSTLFLSYWYAAFLPRSLSSVFPTNGKWSLLSACPFSCVCVCTSFGFVPTAGEIPRLDQCNKKLRKQRPVIRFDLPIFLCGSTGITTRQTAQTCEKRFFRKLRKTKPHWSFCICMICEMFHAKSTPDHPSFPLLPSPSVPPPPPPPHTHTHTHTHSKCSRRVAFWLLVLPGLMSKENMTLTLYVCDVSVHFGNKKVSYKNYNLRVQRISHTFRGVGMERVECNRNLWRFCLV